ncbi:MAG TPA: ABC-F family ATP-binding cassette domain-containing protein [Erysipelothrix sp.]|nr:ABC-F family ATP-binding cassette domain-containing protein [Erysipelothrix sp.]
MILQVRNAYKSFGSQDVFQDLNLLIKRHEKVAIIGANGAGKTTLLRVFSNEESLDSGDVFFRSNTKMGFLDQIQIVDDSVMVKDFFNDVFTDVFELKKRLEEVEKRMVDDHSDEILKTFDRIQTEFIAKGGYTYETDIQTMMTQFNFSVADLNRPINTFSGGQITRLSFIRLLLSKPDILFLDEPTNHLDISTIEWLEGYLASYDGAVVLVSHDRLFLDRVCNTLIELEDGIATRYEANYTNYLKLKETSIAKHNVKVANQKKEIQRLEALIEKYRYKKSKAAFAQSKIKYLDRMDKLEEKGDKKREFKANFKAQIRGGKEVLVMDELSVGYDKPLLEISQTIERGRRFAIVGENGSGKSTLLKTIAGRLPKLSGEMLLGHQIHMGYFDQQLLDFSMSKTVLEEIWDDFPQLDHTEIRTALGRFLFKGEDVFKSVGVLSGGERVRLSLIKLMLSQDNFLVLDEPTNHLDIQGKEALENALTSYDGTMLFVSHDRYFIDKIATDILVLEDGKITHTQKSMTEVINEEKTVAKEIKKSSKEDFVNYKRLQRTAKKLEEELLLLYEELELHRESRFDPDIYHDFEKMNEVNAVIDAIHNDIKSKESDWTNIVMTLEEMDE